MPDEQDDSRAVTAFFEAAMSELGAVRPGTGARVLDFGCGEGRLVERLCRLGFDAYGCDLAAAWPDGPLSRSGRLRTISREPYELPFDDNAFEAVLSTSVLEHARNKEDCFREIHRVLKPGGCAMHLYPGKWYLPWEPHLYVPLVNFFWPRCPAWWLGVWAVLGVRNGFQKGQPWRSVVAANLRYCREGLSYWSTSRYRELSLRIFGNCRWPMRFYIDHSQGGFARLFRRLPLKTLSGQLSRETRMALLVQRKEPRGPGEGSPDRGQIPARATTR